MSKRFNYEKISLNKTILLLILQNKLTLSNINNLLFSISQSKRKNLNNLKFKLISILISNVVKIINNKTLSQNIKKQLQINFALIFQLTNVLIIISRKNVKTLSKKTYEKLIKFKKFLDSKISNNKHLNKRVSRQKKRYILSSSNFQNLIRRFWKIC